VGGPVVETHLWLEGRIFTGNRWCEALIVEDGRVVFAGSAAEARRRRPAGTETHRLRGRIVLPGLVDAHLHLADLTRVREGLDLAGAASLAELGERLRRWADRTPRGGLVGRGWDPERFSERRWPTVRDVDAVVADRPVILYHTSGHAALANSAALESAGIGAGTPDPKDGRIGRDADGEPNGLLFEGAMRSVGAIVAESSPLTPDGLVRTLRHAASFGLTTVATMNTSLEELGALRAATASRAPMVRVRSYLRISALERAYASPKGDPTRDPLRVIGLKAYTDGAFGPRTAWLSRPYADAPSESGLALGTEESLREPLDLGADRDLGPALHAIGDRALERALRLLDGRSGRTSAPPRVEHAALTPPGVWPTLDRVRPVLVVQPGFLWSDWWLGDRLGGERARWAYAFRTLEDRGHLLAGSSDAPYDPLDPWRGIRAAVDRVDPSGRSANPAREEALGPEEAVGLYTRNGGRALGEPEIGTLEEGAPGDLVILRATDRRSFVTEGAAGVLETWMGGRRVHVARSRGGTVKP